jgi:hypothetical protein
MAQTSLDFSGSQCGSITHHPRWPLIAPLVLVEPAEGGRFRLELKSVDNFVAESLLAMQVRCVRCANLIHPIRHRKAPNQRSERLGHGLYLAVACPLKERVGCSRGRLARNEYLRIARAIREAQGVGA